MNRILPLLLQCLLLWGTVGLWGQRMGPSSGPTETGYPFIRNYTPRAYGAEAQNWAVLQDSRGVVFAGNNRGVLTYDGVRWQLLPTAKRTVVRSLGMDATGRVYVGAVGEIGYIVPNVRGENEFVSLNDRIPPEARSFSDVWTIGATPFGILFQSREYLFLLQGDQIRVVKASTTFHLAFVVADRIFVRQRDVGLQELKGEFLSLVPGGEHFARESVFTMLPLGKADGKSPRSILVGTRRIGLWRLDAEGLRRFPTSAETYLQNQVLYNGGQLADGTLALATIKGGVVLLDERGNLQGILDRRSGLQSDNVKALCPDRDSGLWLALDNGISRVEWPSPLSVFDERCGLTGTVWAIQRFQGRLYVATGQGAFILGSAGKGPDPRLRFEPLAGVSTQSIAFLPMEDRLLLASSQGVFEIRGGEAHLVRPSSNSAISLHRSKKDPSRIFVGIQGALVILEHPPGSSIWREAGQIPGVDEDTYSMAEDDLGRLWLGTGSMGAIRITLPPGWKGEASGPPPRIERFGLAEGLPSLIQPYLFHWEGKIRAATQAGMMTFDEGTGRFGPEPRFAALFPGGPRALKAVRVDDAGRIWMDTLDEARGLHETGVAVPGTGGSLRWESAPYRRFAESSIEAIQVDASGVVWFGGPSGVMRYDPASARPPDRPNGVLIRRVSKEGTVVFGGDGPLAKNLGEGPVFPFMHGALRFEFASASFDLESATQYQVRLDGHDRDWSPWISEAQKEYTNLPGGRYCFRVRARDIYGQESPEQAYFFRVLPPWYRTNWALLLFLGMAILAGIAGVRLWTRLLQNRNLALQRRIDLATEDLRERERMLATQAGVLERMNAQLLELNEQKNQFLAIVAHDLRNPLTSILLTSQLIMEEEDLHEIRRRARNIAREGADMENLIGRFLDLSALDAGGIKTEPGHLSLPDLLEGILQRHRPWAQVKGIRFETVANASEHPVFADPKFVSAVLDNLISNAVKFSPLGSVVVLRVEEAEGQVRVAVQDQGPGFTEADQKRLFGRFSRLSAQPTGGEKSVGLGLSIARQMVEACGGRIWVESEAGKGATFMVAFPRSNP